MKTILFFCLNLFIYNAGTFAQYCTPTVTGGSGAYIFNLSFTHAGGGGSYNSGQEGYNVANVASSASTINRYFSFYFVASLVVPTNYYYKIYADLNQDMDFTDPGEELYSGVGAPWNPPSNLTHIQTPNVFLPLSTNTGTIRVRFIVSLATITDPCGSGAAINGEVEDYTVTVPANNAPVLNTAADAVLPAIQTANTNSNGWPLTKITRPLEPFNAMVSDPDDNALHYSAQTARGIAITAQNATNGVWQYKIGNGSWTDIGAVSNANALLLQANGVTQLFNTNTRLRFVPSAAGTATLTFRAWDATQGDNGSYYNIISTGGSTAFSTTTEDIELEVNNTNNIGSTSYVMGGTDVEQMLSGLVNKAAGTTSEPFALANTGPDFSAYDMIYDEPGGKIYWINNSQDKILRADADGANVEELVTSPNAIVGLTLGTGNDLFYITMDDGLYKTDKSGAIPTALTFPGENIAEMFVERGFVYNAGWLYFIYLSNSVFDYHIIRVKADGTAGEELYATFNYLRSLDVSDNYVYWIENDYTQDLINRIPVTGGTEELITTIASGMETQAVKADGASGNLYLISYYAPGYTELYKADISSGDISVLASVDGKYNAMTWYSAMSSTLPVNIVSYKAVKQDRDKALISWKTNMETNNDHFILERSSNGADYFALATIQSKGNGSLENSYAWLDKAPHSGNNLYRLWQVDKDGRKTNLGIRMLAFDRHIASIGIYPNPGRGLFNIRFNSQEQRQIMVVNSAGAIVKQDRITGQLIYPLDITGQPAGKYFIYIKTNNNSEFFKVVIAR